MLFSDLYESRAFRNIRTMEKYSINTLSEIFLIHLLIFHISLTEDLEFSIKYANDTLSFGKFDGIRLCQTDLCNLAATLLHADRYLDEKAKVIPVFELKRYFRDIKKDKIDRYFSENLFLKIQKNLQLNNATMNSLRRDVVGYQILNKMQRLTLCNKIYNLIRKYSYNSDLALELHKILEKF